jgi:hypothetical protein
MGSEAWAGQLGRSATKLSRFGMQFEVDLLFDFLIEINSPLPLIFMKTGNRKYLMSMSTKTTQSSAIFPLYHTMCCYSQDTSSSVWAIRGPLLQWGFYETIPNHKHHLPEYPLFDEISVALPHLATSTIPRWDSSHVAAFHLIYSPHDRQHTDWIHGIILRCADWMCAIFSTIGFLAVLVLSLLFLLCGLWNSFETQFLSPTKVSSGRKVHAPASPLGSGVRLSSQHISRVWILRKVKSVKSDLTVWLF